MTDSWWIKFKRAQRHMVEIRHAARLYAEQRPYQIVRVRPSKKQPKRWRYRLTFDEADPMIVAMIGDFIHNLRSALDHIVFACSKPKDRKTASFPIEVHDIWDKCPACGNFIHGDDERRENFRRAIKGLGAHATAVVLGAQPYQSDTPATHVLGVLSRLENADKHRKIVATGTNLRGGILSVFIRGKIYKTYTIGHRHFFYNNAEVLSFTVANPNLREADVKVEGRGTAMISIKDRGIVGNEEPADFMIYSTMLMALNNVRYILKLMEPYVIRS